MKQPQAPTRCRLTRTQLLTLLTPIAAAFAPFAHAADVFKADNADALNLTTSWVSGALPTLDDVAVFDASVTSIPPVVDSVDGVTMRSYMTFPAAASWKGIRVANAPGVNLSIDSYQQGSPALAIGSAGIDLSAAPSGTIFQMFAQSLTLGTPQTWKVADGATLDIATPTFARAAGATLKLELGATGTGVVKPNGAFGGANVVLGYATINGSDYAAVNATQTALVPGNTLAGIYTANPTAVPPTVSGNFAVLDVVNSGTGATSTALRIGQTTNITGFRFNTAHTGGLDWTVDGSSQTRNINISSGGGVLVGPNVGAHNVIFNPASQFRLGGSAEFIIHQFNPSGDLIFNNPITQDQARAAARVTKTGPGKLILTNIFNNWLGQTTILDGTLQVGNGVAAAPTGNVNDGIGFGAIVNSGVLAFNRPDTYDIPNVISGSGSLQNFGTGILTLSGANTYTGTTQINAGTLAFSNLGNLGAGSVSFAGGSLLWNAGNTADISSRTVTLGAGGATVNTGANNVTFAGSIGNSGAGGITKTGAGTLTLAGANLYSGATTLSAGGLVVVNTVGSATGSGAVSVANTAVLSGTGTIAGSVSIATGGKVAPGVGGVGTLTTGGLSLVAGSLMDLEFTSLSSHDKVVVTGFDGLTLNGGSLLLNPTGTSNSLASVGNYNLIQYAGNLNGAGPSSLTVLNPQPGYSYAFGASGGFVTLSVAENGVLPEWVATGSGSWGSAANWSDGTAAGGGSNYTAQFKATLAAPSVITLDGNRTTKGVAFGGTSGYTIASGTGGSLTIDNGLSAAGVTVDAGNHTISAPVILNSTAGVSVSSGFGLVISGEVSGVGGINKSGAGTLDLTGNNSFSGNVIVAGGTLSFANASSLGSGALTLNGGALRYDVGNSTDISSKVVTFGLNGATINTNGNSITFANSVGNAGSGSLTKSGTGALTLAAANTYTGSTSVIGGSLWISSNSNLGTEASGAQLTLDGAVLVPTATFALNNAGANSRALAIGAGGAEINVGSGLTFTVSGAMSGPGTASLVKSGEGDLTVSGLNDGFSGPVTIAAGSVHFGAVPANFQTGLGTGPITFADGTHLYLNGQGVDAVNYGNLTNAISVPASVTTNIHAPQNAAYTGVASGAGTLNLFVDGANFSVIGGWGTNFTGILNVNKTPTGDGTDIDAYCLNGAHDLSSATVNVGAGVRMRQNFNPTPGVDGAFTTHRFGALNAAVGSILGGNQVAARYNVYSIGALNGDSTINGQFVGLSGGSGGVSFPLLTKEGTGTLTLNGTTHMMATPAAVAGIYSLRVTAGTLKVLGAVERFYRLPGVDVLFATADDQITQTLPTGVEGTDYQVVEPGPNLVAVGATLGGNGRLGGLTSVLGNLRTDSTGTLGGQLAFTGAATLTLDPASTTTFDFGGTVFTGVKLANGISYGGTLKLNFLNTVYNNSYKLFDITGAPSGAFTGGVTVTTTTTTDAVLTDASGVGSGPWTGTVDGASFSFDASTGVLTVTGGATAVLPGTPSGVGATAGNAQVALAWSAASNASNYLVKRATTAAGPYTTLTNAVVTTSYTDTGLTNGTTYYYVIQAQNGAGFGTNSAEVSATPAAVVLSGLQSWRQANFGTTQNTGDAADNADFDHDGIVNLLEYATGRDPKVANAAPVLTTGTSAGSLTVTYNRIADATLTYTVQGTNDLAGTPVWGTVATSTGAANVAGSVLVTDTQLISASPRRFLRLSVSYTTN